MLERILIPLDGSRSAESALTQVRRLLPRQKADVTLLRVVNPSPAEFHLGLPGSTEEKAYLERIAAGLSSEGIRVGVRVRAGTPAGCILDTAREERATLIVLSTHARTGLARWVLGSVAEQLIQDSPIPLLVFRAPAAKTESPDHPGPFRRILLPSDGSLASLDILPQVCEIARPVDARVTLLSVKESGEPEGRWPQEEASLKAAEKHLKEACIVTRYLERRGEPVEEILREAVDDQADLIAMATHGRSGPSRWILGSVTSEVLRRAPLPLMILHRGAAAGSR
jgi:nucleotide-binding universal stress UspA family protein